MRNAVLSVLAFDAEISGLSRVAKSPAAAEMRYEFWRIGLRKLREGSLEPNGKKAQNLWLAWLIIVCRLQVIRFWILWPR